MSEEKKKSIDYKAKIARDTGTEGVSRSGKVIQARKIGTGCKKNCRFKCHTKITYEQREQAFSSFWNLGNHAQQWACISQWVIKLEPASTSKNVDPLKGKKKKYSHIYTLPADGKIVKVCKEMFLDTLGIYLFYPTIFYPKILIIFT